MLASLLGVAAVLVLSVTFVLFDPDFWQHLLVGKVIWQLHSVPHRQIWTWPTYGVPDITHSWLFRALIWPVWSVGGVWGLFAWRWIMTLVTFGFLWATGRRMGARGFAALGALLVCGLAYRTRSQIRPETLAVVLMALEIWILETRRRQGPDRSLWVVAVAWVWANAHISYHLGFLILGAYLVDEGWHARPAASQRRRLRPLIWVALASLAISFANPFGWLALWQPFEYLFHLSHELLYKQVDELRPFDWQAIISSGLILPLLSWPVLALGRIVRRGADRVELIQCAFFSLVALQSQRFFGFYAVAAAPFLMRDLDEWTADLRWPRRRAPTWARASALAALCVVVGYGELSRPVPRAGVGIDYQYVPVRACDFIAEHGIRGRAFHPFHEGGYLLYRFWPDPGRLPFMDIHMVGGPEIRLLYTRAFASVADWRALDDRFHIDYVLMDRFRYPGHPFLDILDADTTLALVFADDAAAVYVRRRGPLSPVADRFAYRCVPAGQAKLGPLFERCAKDSTFRAEVAAELERRAGGSPWNAQTLDLLADLALGEGRLADAREFLARALRVSPWIGRAHERLGVIALASGQPRDALREFEIERSIDARRPGVALHIGLALRRLGRESEARAWYRRELEVDPGSTEALDSLQKIRRGS
jgi:hypothetical protein